MEKWYCVSGEYGDIQPLGEHDCFDSADAYAIDAGYQPVWTFGEETFFLWRDQLNSMKGV